MIETGRTDREGRVFQDDHASGPDPDPDRSSHGTSTGWPALIGFVGLSLLLAAAEAAAVPPAAREWLLSLIQPPAPAPAGLIAPSWAVLSVPSGIGAWLAWREPGHRQALLLWGWHLLACAAWMQCLLSLQWPGGALVAALALALLAGLTVRAFGRLSRAAGLLLVPTLAWTCYAAFVTVGFWWLNRGIE